jgi:predicted MFS family arabinose efflux permease
LAFVGCAMVSIALPKQVDSTNASVRTYERASTAVTVPGIDARPARLGRVYSWARRGFEPQVITALQGESALRFLSGFLTIFLAFYIEATAHGFAAAGQLGAVGVAAGAGNFAGTGVGARLKLGRPEVLIMVCLAVAAVATVVAAIFFRLPLAIAAMFASAVTNSLAKVALDAVIQRDVLESLRSSAFGRSEAFLQLAWVLGAAIACLLPGKNGALGFWLAGVFVAVLAIIVALRNRAMRHEAEVRDARATALPRYLPDQPHA